MKTLSEYQKEYPELTFNNKGYETLPQNVMDKYSEQIAEIEKILKLFVEGFVEFNNFKPLSDGSIDVRIQCYYGNSFSFVGVDYIPIKEIDEHINTLNKANTNAESKV